MSSFVDDVGALGVVGSLAGLYFGYTWWAPYIGFTGTDASGIIARLLIAPTLLLLGLGVGMWAGSVLGLADSSGKKSIRIAGVGTVAFGILAVVLAGASGTTMVLQYLFAGWVEKMVSTEWMAAIVLGWVVGAAVGVATTVLGLL